MEPSKLAGELTFKDRHVNYLPLQSSSQGRVQYLLHQSKVTYWKGTTKMVLCNNCCCQLQQCAELFMWPRNMEKQHCRVRICLICCQPPVSFLWGRHHLLYQPLKQHNLVLGLKAVQLWGGKRTLDLRSKSTCCMCWWAVCANDGQYSCSDATPTKRVV